MIHWLSKSFLMVVLLVVIALLLLVPARHVLLPQWPWPVEERIMAEPVSNGVYRKFVAVHPDDRDERSMIARDRPITLAAVEKDGGETVHGFVVGVRPEAGAELMDRVPAWLFDLEPDGSRPANAVFVMMLSDESISEFTLGEVVRIYRPNQLSLVERIVLTGQRIAESWRARQWSLDPV